MGLFSQRPEHIDEWAGLPSEPLRPESPAERLTDAVFSVDPLGNGGAFESISIPIPTAPDEQELEEQARDDQD